MTRGVPMTGHSRPVRGESDDWLTPPNIIDALGPFDLDPCASVDQPWGTAATQYVHYESGLEQSWEGFVWLNPPFGNQAGAWLRRLAEHGNGIALCAARTETRWFVEIGVGTGERDPVPAWSSAFSSPDNG